MYRLTREVRFAVAADGAPLPPAEFSNGYAGHPPLAGLGHWFALAVTVEGQPEPSSCYLLNIKDVDRQVRQRAVPLLERAVRDRSFGGGGSVLRVLFSELRSAWPGIDLRRLRLCLSPFLALSVLDSEHPMVRLSQKFEFSAAHRLYNDELSEGENRSVFGKCSNDNYHGHNYELEVTVRGEADAQGALISIPALQRLVIETVIDRFDHKNLNLDTAEFADRIPSVENIAAVIHGLLKPRFAGQRAQLAAITVWETPKTWCEYSE